MPKTPYQDIETLIARMPPEFRSIGQKILAENRERFETYPGSQKNHQAWPGGYLDHVTEVMNLAEVFYHSTYELREIGSFSLGDAFLVLFLHDLEKAFPDRIQALEQQGWGYKEAKSQVRWALIEEYGLTNMLTEEQYNALRYIEGEGPDYSNSARTMRPLAAFCHCCDVWSARIWYNRPFREQDTWGSRQRHIAKAA